jgi:hypothetical protein
VPLMGENDWWARQWIAPAAGKNVVMILVQVAVRDWWKSMVKCNQLYNPTQDMMQKMSLWKQHYTQNIIKVSWVCMDIFLVLMETDAHFMLPVNDHQELCSSDI